MKPIIMKRTWPILMCLLFPALIIAQTQDKLLYCTVTQQWSLQEGIWINDHRLDYQYDSMGRVVEEFKAVWDEELLMWHPPYEICYFICSFPSGEVKFEYNERGKLIKRSNYGWDEGDNEWVELNHKEWKYRSDGQPEWYEYIVLKTVFPGSNTSIRTEYTYNDSGNLVSTRELTRDPSEAVWSPNTLEEISTIASENRKVAVTLNWDDGQNEWVLHHRSDTIYNSLGLVSDWSFYSVISGNDWIPEDSATVVYNEQGFPVEEYFFGPGQGGEWFNFSKIISEYTPDGQLEERTQYNYMEGTDLYQEAFRRQYLYSPDGTPQQLLTLSWNSMIGTWSEQSLDEWMYDSLQQVVKETNSYMDEAQGRWVASNQKVYEYDGYGNQTLVTTFHEQNPSVDELTASERQLAFWALPDSVPVIILNPELLEALLEAGLDTNDDRSISQNEAEAVTYLDISGRGITDLGGLDVFVHLDTLICHDNPLRGLDPSDLPGLTYLDCSRCGLYELNAGALPELTTLICSGNFFTRLVLTDMLHLKYLDLSGMQELYEVCVWKSPFPPAGVQLITEGSPRLRFTEDCSVRITDPMFYQALLEEGVDLNGDSLITASEAAAVTELDISMHQIDNLTGLEYFIRLKRLDCSQNDIQDLDLSGFPDLQYLDCSGCYLDRLELSNLADLQYLDCSGSYLQTLDLSENKLITTLMCANCGLGSLDISGCSYLYFLDAEGNGLSRLNLAENKSLVYIDISDMPGLEEVCVWQYPFPLSGIEVRYENSYQVHFDTECALEQDRFENNDTRQAAVPLIDNMLFDRLTVSLFDGDWYMLAPRGEAMIKSLLVECRFSHDSGDINMEVLNEAGRQLAAAKSRSDNESISIPMNPLERYYLHVHLDSGQVNTYSLSWISQVYTTNSSLDLCLPGKECETCDLNLSLRDTVYRTDTLAISLYAGDTAVKTISLENCGPESYAYYTSLKCIDVSDDGNVALQFDGVDDRLEIMRDACIDLSQEISLEAWIMPEESAGDYEPIISRSLNGYGYELFRKRIDGQWKLGFSVDHQELISERLLETDRWYHVAVTYDSKAIRLYLNGDKDTSVFVPGSISLVNQSVVVGANSPMEMNRDYFTGKIDEIRIWSTVRSFMEVKANFQQKLSGHERGLEAYYTLDDAFKMVAVDRTGKTRATITGGAERIPSTAPSVRMVRVYPFTSFLAKGSFFPLRVEANAFDLGAGTYQMDLQIYSNVEAHPDIRIPIKVEVKDAASISIFPDTLDFGTMEIYKTKRLELEVANHGTRELVLDSLSTSVDGTRILPAACAIPPGESRTFQMDAFFRFEDTYRGTLLIPSNDPTDSEILIPVMATAEGISKDVLLKTIDDTIPAGYFIGHGLLFENPSDELACPYEYRVEYLTFPGMKNDRLLRSDSANWLFINLPEGWNMITPGGSQRINIYLDASFLNPGDYYGQFILEWYSLAKVRGFIPIHLHVKAPLGIEPQPDDSEVLIYPNPTEGRVTLVTGVTSPYQIMVTSLTGQVMKEITANEPELQLDLSSLEKGIYLVTVRSASGQHTLRLVRY